MKPLFVLAGTVLAAMSSLAMAQEANAPALGEVVVTANRLSAPYANRTGRWWACAAGRIRR